MKAPHALIAIACVALCSASVSGSQRVPAAAATPIPVATPAPTGTLRGTISVLGPDGPLRGPSASVVWLPGTQSTNERPQPVVTSRNKQFTPRVLPVTLGTTVTFPNQDPVFHNAFSLSRGNRFDLGLYRKGGSASVQLAQAGVVRVFCNIHPSMASYLLVLEGTAYTVVEPDGAYRITGIPAGRHEVQLWNEMARKIEKAAVEIRPGETTVWDASVDASRYRRQAHKNKYGRDYEQPKSDADRY
jgi:plastocyanin